MIFFPEARAFEIAVVESITPVGSAPHKSRDVPFDEIAVSIEIISFEIILCQSLSPIAGISKL